MYLKIIQLYRFHLVIAYYFLDTGSYQLSPGTRFLRAPNLFGQASPFIIASTKDYTDYRKFKIIIMVLLEPRLLVGTGQTKVSLNRTISFVY